jgi:hypothetical protein
MSNPFEVQANLAKQLAEIEANTALQKSEIEKKKNILLDNADRQVSVLSYTSIILILQLTHIYTKII